jgi:AcrR family transcriptional regulator
MSIPAETQRRQRRADARPQELLSAAMAVFVERGYAETHVEEIARRAGVAKATIYLYYENKLELFKAVARNSLVAGFEDLSKTYFVQNLSAREQLILALSVFMERVAGSALSGIPKLIIAEAGNFPEIARFYYDEVIVRVRALTVRVLAEGARSGEFRHVDSDYVWRIIVAPLLLSIIWKHSFQVFEPEPLDFRRHLAAQLDLLFDGLATDSNKATRPSGSSSA